MKFYAQVLLQFPLLKARKAQVQNTIFCLLCVCCTITIKRCKLLICGAAQQRCGSLDLSENSWALLPCGEEIKTLQTPMWVLFYQLFVTTKPTAELKQCYKCVSCFKKKSAHINITLNKIKFTYTLNIVRETN